MFFYTFLPILLNMSLTASVVIVFVLLLRLLLKKAPKVISYALWGIVLFRLLCPISIGSGLSLFGLLDTPVATSGTLASSIAYIPSDIVHTEYPSLVLPAPGIGEAISETLPQGEEQLVADPLEAPTAIATYIWMAGVVAMGIYAVVSYLRLRRKLMTASLVRENIYLADEIPSPFVMGLIHPKIYLPSSLGEREQSYVVMHEQHHIRRLDHIMKVLAFIALSIHWFNPLVWLAFVMAGRDMEMSCDEAVVRKMGDGILADYAASLLSLATGKHIIAGMPLAFGEGDTKGRIRNLAKWKKPKRIVFAFVCLLVVISAFILVSNPSSTQLSKLNIDEVHLSAALADIRSLTVQYHDSSTICNDEATNCFIDAIRKIQVRQKPVSESRAEDRSRSFTVVLNDNLHLYFNEDFSEIWFDNGVKPSYSYSIINQERSQKLMMDFYSILDIGKTTVTEWFDFTDNPSDAYEYTPLYADLPEFPNATFRYAGNIAVSDGDASGPRVLITGMPIWNAYFCDLTGDNLPEICATLSIGSGMIDNRIIIYDYANGVCYELEDRGNYDYTLSLQDDKLIVTKCVYDSSTVVETGYLAYLDDTIQIIPRTTDAAKSLSGTADVSETGE